MKIIGLLVALIAPSVAFGDSSHWLADIPALIKGEVVDRAKFPATIWIGNCTASVVGSRSVYTAAHCVSSNIAFSIGTDRYTAKCMVAPEYRGNATADYALCYSDREIEGIPYERVNIDPTLITKGDWILQSGFGCTRWGGRIDGQLRTGRSKVLQTPAGSSNDYVTGEGAVLCSGDSGGPAWSIREDGERGSLISVNSRSNTTSRSYLSAIATTAGIRFTESYATRNSTRLCGVHADALGCRPDLAREPVTIEVSNSQVKLMVVIQPSANYSADEAKKALEMALNSLEGDLK